MLLITTNFESHARRLVSPETSVAQKQQLVTEMRDSIEIVHTSEYGNFLRHLFPAFYRLLSEGQPQFTEARRRVPPGTAHTLAPAGAAETRPCATARWLASPLCPREPPPPPTPPPTLGLPRSLSQGPEQKIRNMLLEVLNRLPNNETLRPHVLSMLTLCMKLLETDNEENAVISLRIIFDLHKNFRPTLEREVALCL